MRSLDRIVCTVLETYKMFLTSRTLSNERLSKDRLDLGPAVSTSLRNRSTRVEVLVDVSLDAVEKDRRYSSRRVTRIRRRTRRTFVVDESPSVARIQVNRVDRVARAYATRQKRSTPVITRLRRPTKRHGAEETFFISEEQE